MKPVFCGGTAYLPSTYCRTIAARLRESWNRSADRCRRRVAFDDDRIRRQILEVGRHRRIDTRATVIASAPRSRRAPPRTARSTSARSAWPSVFRFRARPFGTPPEKWHPRSKYPRLLKKPRSRKLCFIASMLSARSAVASRACPSVIRMSAKQSLRRAVLRAEVDDGAPRLVGDLVHVAPSPPAPGRRCPARARTARRH